MKWLKKIVHLFTDDSPSLLAFSRILASGLALISAPIVARAIGPAGRGETAAAIALFHIVPVVLAFGVPLVVRRRSATTDGKQAIATARLIAIIGFVPAAAAALLVSNLLLRDFDPVSRAVATVGIAAAPMVMSWMCDIGVLIAHARYRAVFAMQIIQPVAYLTLILTVSLLGIASTATVLACYLSGLLATFVTGIVLVRGDWSGALKRLPGVTREGTKFAGAALAETASNRLDQAIALPLLGASQAGLYAVATTIVTIPLALGQALGAAYFTPIARAEAGDARRGLQQQAARSAFAIAPLAFIAMCIAAPLIVPLLFGSEFAGAVPVVWIASTGGIAMTSGYVLSMALAADGRGVRMTIAQTVGLALGLAALFALGPILGALGAAIASSLGYLLMLVMLATGLRSPVSSLIPRVADAREAIRRLTKRD
ncbi:lipopolysaccharide biosynthesis protein [Pseudoclavibacter sp. RFBA6]|uniref:lipopolysaccharide biosynthesis protein n=1 Tax=Pseudoclavibacter sp. RFBA6 TaxID=2080573 RepID=UPI000CE8E734|nr:oligosaccharide flippase family protein [Pseudoclavibacter sp. RFBA6]PPG43388.1 hypothetical protein C5C17_02220 [Pseudoclavibacter sp. RFBA6]